MNSQTTSFRIARMEQDLLEIKQDVKHLTNLLQDLIKLMAPTFPHASSSGISNELIEASNRGIIYITDQCFFYH